jgi:hypothetical protein
MKVHIGELVPGPAERALVFGTSRAGKSSLMDFGVRHVQATRPNAMQLLVDTKPRFRAEQEPYLRGKMRRNAAHNYSGWSKGPVVPNSVVMDIHSDNPFAGMWKNPGEVVIMQSGESEDWRLMLRLLKKFVAANIGDRERRIIVDEALDFYQRNTWGIDARNDVLYRAARAGGERNIGIELGAHRVQGIPILILNMSSRVTLFHLKEEEDMKYLRRAGIYEETSPDGDYVFKQWQTRPGGTTSSPFTGKVTYPDSYLKQLATT